jgi:ribA/ribD-fused uncharacterized protein
MAAYMELFNSMVAAIASFTGKYRYLSNFYIVPISLDGELYRSLEHAYQAAKTWPENRANIRLAATPGLAKRLGRSAPLRENWDLIKNQVMLDLLRQKFTGSLAQQLLATGDAELIEQNDWGDVYWGRCDGVGQNWLGKLLMQVRSELQQLELEGG